MNHDVKRASEQIDQANTDYLEVYLGKRQLLYFFALLLGNEKADKIAETKAFVGVDKKKTFQNWQTLLLFRQFYQLFIP